MLSDRKNSRPPYPAAFRTSIEYGRCEKHWPRHVGLDSRCWPTDATILQRRPRRGPGKAKSMVGDGFSPPKSSPATTRSASLSPREDGFLPIVRQIWRSESSTSGARETELILPA